MSSARNSSKRSAMRNTSAESKLIAIRRVQEGESKASVARDIGVPESTLRGWCKNVSRISHQTRQSSPDTDESLEPKEKKPKTFSSPTMVQPFNLSLRTPSSSSSAASTSYYASQSSKALYTPMDYSKSELDYTPKTPQNLSIKTETPKLTASQSTEKEKKKAELAKLSVEFGLNRPEIVAGSFSEFAHTMNSTNRWTGLLSSCHSQQQQQQQQQLLNTNGFSKKKTTTELSPIAKNSKVSLDLQSMDDYLNSWTKTQAVIMQLAGQINICDLTNTSLNGSNLSADVLNHSTSRNGTSNSYNGLPSSPQSSAPMAKSSSESISKQSTAASLLTWYQDQLSYYSTPTSSETKPILYQQLTKDSNEVENLSMNNSNSTATTSKSILDHLLLANNNNNNIINDHNLSHDISPEEAVEHGDKFMKWLETFTSPSVTAVQIMQFRSLLTNVKNSINPKNGEVKNKTKVRRK